MKSLVKATVAAVIILGTPCQSRSDVTGVDDETVALAGLGGISVLVEEPVREGKMLGVSAEEIKAMVELRLRQSGIIVRRVGVVTEETPTLYVNVNLVPFNEVKHFSFNTRIALQQSVLLPRNGQRVRASSWERANLGFCPNKSLREHVNSSLDQLVTIFLNAYLAANQ